MSSSAGSEAGHVPVLPKEVVSFLSLRPGDLAVDATCGTGGHTQLLCEEVGSEGLVIAVDRDEKELLRTKERLSEYEGRLRFFYADFKDFDEVMKHADLSRINGCLFDLGLSSVQIDSPERGFSYVSKGPLDMRMDRASGLTARDVVNTYSFEDLRTLFRDYGDERHAGRIARAVVERRERCEFEDTEDLADCLRRASRGRRGTAHPEAPLFMALRIEVNDEFAALRRELASAVSFLADSARAAVISFHSGEDRIVKHLFRDFEDKGIIRSLTSSPVTASDEEIADNPRSRGAKLRVAERIV